LLVICILWDLLINAQKMEIINTTNKYFLQLQQLFVSDFRKTAMSNFVFFIQNVGVYILVDHWLTIFSIFFFVEGIPLCSRIEKTIIIHLLSVKHIIVLLVLFNLFEKHHETTMT